NRPPTLALESQASVTLPNALSLTATVTDDGLPTPRKGPRRAAVGQETPPTLKPDPNQPEILLNVPQVSRGGPGPRPPPGAAPTRGWSSTGRCGAVRRMSCSTLLKHRSKTAKPRSRRRSRNPGRMY